jgi:selenocysteine-specific elongation factor
MIIGSAGHIDHGKSTLISALTGRPMDRLAEERRREITIELNFAPLDLGSTRMAGVIDVPGHEDFVRTMVAGASGIDLALLVVAADEGIRPQTEEHLIILEQLGIAAGIPVVTKADLVEEDWLQLVMLEISERLGRSSISFEPPLAVSARTGLGLAALRTRLADYARTLEGRPSADVFRMPIDRVFSLSGVGTVVTGTAWSGALKVGDSVLALPAGARGRVRSLESFGRPVDRSESGARTAVAIVGIERAALTRGQTLLTPDLPWASTSALDVEIALQAEATRPLNHRSRVRLLLGTAEVMARVLPQSPIEPGGRGMARLKLETPLVARARDRFVLRSYSPVTTIGGGRVLDPLPPPRRSLWPAALASLEPVEHFRSMLQRRPAGIETGALPILTGLPPAAATGAAREVSETRLLDDLWVSAKVVEEVRKRALSVVKAYHGKHPADRGMPLETLRHALRASQVIVEAALDDALRAGRLRRHEGLVALSGFAPKVVGGEVEIDRIIKLVADAHLSPPSVAELEHVTGRRDLPAILRLAAARGYVEAVERDRYYARGALDQFAQVLNEMGQQGPIVPSEVRDRLGISRKYLIPLLEWADGRGITVRDGEGRRLKTKSGA